MSSDMTKLPMNDIRLVNRIELYGCGHWLGWLDTTPVPFISLRPSLYHVRECCPNCYGHKLQDDDR